MRGKPGTKDQQRRKDAMRELGCVACILDKREPGFCYEGICEIHHMLSGNKKLGEGYTVPLCEPHHTGPVLSWHRTRRQFRARYGGDLSLIVKTDVLLEERGLWKPNQEAA